MAKETITTRRSTMTSRPSSEMTIRWVMPDLGRSDVCPRLLLLLWAFFMIITWILLVIAFTRADWIEGTEALPNGGSLYREVGLFEQCDNVNGDKSCFNVGFSNSSIEEWYAAGVLFVCGMIFLTCAIVLALVAACIAVGVLVPAAKITMSIANLFFIIAAMLYPIGFRKLDNGCDSTGDGQCGLRCTDPSNDFNYFVLCSPYELGSATFLMVAALIILYLSACLTICIRIV